MTHQPETVAVASNSQQLPVQTSKEPAKAESKNTDDYEDIADLDKEGQEEKIEIADPLEPFNRAMYHFNDKLYFWVLKPVAQGYSKAVPEPARISVGNFFSNLAFPVRFINCLLQADPGGAAEELGRFTINTVWGMGGLLDPASNKEINLVKQDRDFGQTLGVYGVGQGLYINWPVLGPSSPRDTVGFVGDLFSQPVTYLNPWYLWIGVRAYDRVNDTSLRIGDYESLKEAAIDPYVAIRDAYVQYRLKKVKKGGSGPPSAEPVLHGK
ncbi:MAG: VacJ family lipoprotein [Syntrophales bacterium]|nr:VacJ family lipoprotein [Syntrophales bacterium]